MYRFTDSHDDYLIPAEKEKKAHMQGTARKTDDDRSQQKLKADDAQDDSRHAKTADDGPERHQTIGHNDIDDDAKESSQKQHRGAEALDAATAKQARYSELLRLS